MGRLTFCRQPSHQNPTHLMFKKAKDWEPSLSVLLAFFPVFFAGFTPATNSLAVISWFFTPLQSCGIDFNRHCLPVTYVSWILEICVHIYPCNYQKGICIYYKMIILNWMAYWKHMSATNSLHKVSACSPQNRKVSYGHHCPLFHL